MALATTAPMLPQDKVKYVEYVDLLDHKAISQNARDVAYHAHDDTCGLKVYTKTGMVLSCLRSGSRYDCPHHPNGFCAHCGTQLKHRECPNHSCSFKSCMHDYGFYHCNLHAEGDVGGDDDDARCEFHRTCNIEGCSDTTLYYYYCAAHSCLFSQGCDKPRMDNVGNHCADHTCAYIDCLGEVSPDDKTLSVFCDAHECDMMTCAALAEPGQTACETHTCSIDGCTNTCKTYIECGADGEATTLNIFEHCAMHSCQVMSCSRTTTDGSVACSDHVCHMSGCINVQKLEGVGEYCVDHSCINLKCAEGVRDGLIVCAEHACAYAGCSKPPLHGKYNCESCKCAIRDCTHTVFTGSTCTFHTCANESEGGCSGRVFRSACKSIRHQCRSSGCTNSALVPGSGCSGHTCRNKSCSSYVRSLASTCKQHICKRCGKGNMSAGKFKFCKDCVKVMREYPCTRCKKKIQHLARYKSVRELHLTKHKSHTGFYRAMAIRATAKAKYGTLCPSCFSESELDHEYDLD